MNACFQLESELVVQNASVSEEIKKNEQLIADLRRSFAESSSKLSKDTQMSSSFKELQNKVDWHCLRVCKCNLKSQSFVGCTEDGESDERARTLSGRAHSGESR